MLRSIGKQSREGIHAVSPEEKEKRYARKDLQKRKVLSTKIKYNGHPRPLAVSLIEHL